MARKARNLIRNCDASYALESTILGPLEGELINHHEQAKLKKLISKWAGLFTLKVEDIAVNSRGFSLKCCSYTNADKIPLIQIKQRLTAFYLSYYPPETRQTYLNKLEKQDFLEKERQRLGRINEFMKVVKICFTAWYNERYQRQGPVFAGRYKSELLQVFKKAIKRVLQRVLRQADEATSPINTSMPIIPFPKRC